MRPGEGTKPASGSSAQTRASMATPRSDTRRSARLSPRAIRICSWTRSRPVIASVMPCSTCRRGFISSRCASAPATRNSTVPSPTYPTSRARRTAAAASRASSAGSSPGGGASSISFWWRRWTEQSRAPRAFTWPRMSAAIWTSTCRAPETLRSRNRRPSPNAASASAAAERNAAGSAAAFSTTRITRPPPPAAAFTTSG